MPHNASFLITSCFPLGPPYFQVRESLPSVYVQGLTITVVHKQGSRANSLDLCDSDSGVLILVLGVCIFTTLADDSDA